MPFLFITTIALGRTSTSLAWSPWVHNEHLPFLHFLWASICRMLGGDHLRLYVAAMTTSRDGELISVGPPSPPFLTCLPSFIRADQSNLGFMLAALPLSKPRGDSPARRLRVYHAPPCQLRRAAAKKCTGFSIITRLGCETPFVWLQPAKAGQARAIFNRQSLYL